MRENITQTALEAQIVSRFTSLVAVDTTPSKPISMQSKEVDVANANAQHLAGQLPQTALGLGMFGWLGIVGLCIWSLGYVGLRRWSA